VNMREGGSFNARQSHRHRGRLTVMANDQSKYSHHRNG
jgi:hypothetical protein